MNKISRIDFIKLSALGMAASVVPQNILYKNEGKKKNNDSDFLKNLLHYNDTAIERYIKFNTIYPSHKYHRPSIPFAVLAASYCQPDSKYFKSKAILHKADEIISNLLESQYHNGTIDAGGNRQSPPDTAFLLEFLCPAAKVLNRQDFSEIKTVKDKLAEFILKAGEGLITGGVHTSNHRWVVSSALARLYSIYHDERYLKRIDEWLAEGIYMDDDGQYAERSRNYSIVVNNSLLNIGLTLNQPSFFEIVKRNLVSNYYYMETNGDLVTLDSRRQDQNFEISAAGYYLFYRYLAIRDNDQFLSGVAHEIESFPNFSRIVLYKSLILCMGNLVLLEKMPPYKKLPADYSKLFAQSGLARIRRENVTASIFGGDDKPLIIASGRSCNPDYFTFRKGEAVLEYARLSTNFFHMGFFRSNGVVKSGNTYVLTEKKEAYYYQPLPENKRNKTGNYKLTESMDRRFWSKMAFEDRPRTTLTLETRVIVYEENGIFKMDFELNGPPNVEVTLEFCFNYGGTLEGVTTAPGSNDYFLKSGYAKYRFNNEVIKIGPGKYGHDRIRRLGGEEYSTHFGSIKGRGKHVYITGFVPFKHSISIG